MALQKQMEKYRDVDEDELLQKLSEEELQRLEDELEELDPDVSGSIMSRPLSCAPSLSFLHSQLAGVF